MIVKRTRIAAFINTEGKMSKKRTVEKNRIEIQYILLRFFMFLGVKQVNLK